MKKLNYFISLFCSIVFMSILGACSNNEDRTSVPINIQDICKTYPQEQVKMTFNGDEISSSGDVSLKFIATSKCSNRISTSQTVSNSEKMLLEIPPLWPNVHDSNIQSVFDNIIFEVDAVFSLELVTFTGEIEQYGYKLAVRGIYKEETLTLNLTYSTTYSMIGNRYVFDFSRESLNMGMLNPKENFVEWKEEQIPTKEFVTDAIVPILETIKERLGGVLCIEFFSDGYTSLEIKSQKTGEVTPVPGKHGFRYFGSDFGYFMADEEGALWMSKTVSGDFTFNSAMYTSKIGMFHFMPVCFSKDNTGDKLILTLEDPIGNCFQNFLFFWLDCLGNTELSTEEFDKAFKVAMLLQNETIKQIRLTGNIDN